MKGYESKINVFLVDSVHTEIEKIAQGWHCVRPSIVHFEGQI